MAVIIVFIVFSNVWVVGSTRDKIYTNNNLPIKPSTLLLLGTSHKTINGEENKFYRERIKTASSLYKTGLVARIILSGDHATKYYNEPLRMRTSLTDLGVPDSILVTDDGGVRTLDSIIRSKEVFGADNMVIVTQRFHAYRALFISNYYQMDAIAVVTQPMESTDLTGVLLREFLARPLAVLDLYLFHRQPLYETEKIN